MHYTMWSPLRICSVGVEGVEGVEGGRWGDIVLAMRYAST